MSNNNQQNNPTDEQLKDQLEDAVRREMEARNRERDLRRQGK